LQHRTVFVLSVCLCVFRLLDCSGPPHVLALVDGFPTWLLAVWFIGPGREVRRPHAYYNNYQHLAYILSLPDTSQIMLLYNSGT
jgi:hypothetical protein